MSRSLSLDGEYVSTIQALPPSGLLHSLILLNRLSLGWYVMNAGWDKVKAEVGEGFGAFLNGNTFQRRSGILPEFLEAPFGYAWPWLELTCGFLLIIGLFGRATAAVTAWLLASISIAVMVSGDEFFPRHYLMVFVPLALLLCLFGSGRYSVDWLLHTRKTGRGGRAS
jgi:uncharacterized membrane protein YphA (DoxX/SURF4 family)